MYMLREAPPPVASATYRALPVLCSTSVTSILYSPSFHINQLWCGLHLFIFKEGIETYLIN